MGTQSGAAAGQSGSNTFRWLHLTDLHLGMAGQGPLWPNTEEALFEDFTRLHKAVGPWDAVLFTGDMTQRGSKEEFEALDHLLQKFWAHFKKMGFAPKLLAVPGNHDLIRPKNRSDLALISLLKSWCLPEVHEPFWKDAGCAQRRLIVEAFQPFAEWWRQTTIPKPSSVVGGLLPGDCSASFKAGNFDVGVIGLNSAYLQLAEGDFTGRLHVDVQQLHQVCEGHAPDWTKRHDACLLLTHHPAEWLSAEAKDHFRDEIHYPPERFALHLFGHMHESDHTSMAHGGGNARSGLQGCSLFGMEPWGAERASRKHGYSLGELKSEGDELRLRIWPRVAIKKSSGGRRLERDSAFTLDESDGGTESAVVKRLKARPAPAPAPALALAPALATSAAAATPTPTPTSRSGPAVQRLALMLDTPGVWDSLVASGFVGQLQEKARAVASAQTLTVDSVPAFCLLYLRPEISPYRFLFMLAGAFAGSSQQHEWKNLNPEAVEALILLCYLFAERCLLAQEALKAPSKDDFTFPVKDRVIAVIAAAIAVQQHTGNTPDFGLSVKGGQMVAHGAFDMTDAAIELNSTQGANPLDIVKSQLTSMLQAFSPAAPDTMIYKGATRTTEHVRWEAEELLLNELKRVIEETAGRPCDPILTVKQSGSDHAHFLLSADTRASIQEKLKLPTVVYGVGEQGTLEADISAALSRALQHLPDANPSMHSQQRHTKNDSYATPHTVSSVPKETAMTITTLTVSYASTDEKLWDLLRPQLQGRLRAHSNPLMKKLSIWTFREIAGGQNDDPAIQEKFRAETSGGLLCVSVDACASSYIQQSEWPVFRDSGGKVLKRFVATMLTLIDEQNMDLGVLQRIGASATQLMHLSYEGKRYSWSDCVDHGAENGGSKRLANLFVAKLINDLETQLFPSTAP